MKLTKLELFMTKNPNMSFDAMAGQLNRTVAEMERVYNRLRKKEQKEKSREDFLRGFVAATALHAIEADEQWSGFSRQLTDREVERAEAGGYQSGYSEGLKFNAAFPNNP